MKIEITAGGIYDGEGKEVPIGTTFDVNDEPKGWEGRYRIASGGGAEGKALVTNPAQSGYAVKEAQPGWFVITKDGAEVTKNFRKAELDGFDAMSDEDKGAFVDLHKKDA